jgi:hypothetical protein
VGAADIRHDQPGRPRLAGRAATTWRHVDASVQALDTSGDLAAALAAAGLAGTFEPARAGIAASHVYRRALTAADDGIGALRLAVARAIVAEALAEHEDAGTRSCRIRLPMTKWCGSYKSRSAAASWPGPAAAAGSGRRSGHHRSVSIATPTPTAHPPTMSDG